VNAPAPKLSPGTLEAASAHVVSLLPRLRLVNRQSREAEHKIGVLINSLMATNDSEATGESEPGQKKQRDAAILASFPGLGRTVLATLLAEASEPLQRRDYQALRSLGGAAPVTRRSGKSFFVVRRRACNQRLANCLYQWAFAAIQYDPRSRAKYAELRKRGCTHGRALRAVADRNLNIACAMLKSGTMFDPKFANQNAKKTA
jgi:transposase